MNNTTNDPIWNIAEEALAKKKISPSLLELLIDVRNNNREAFKLIEGTDTFAVKPWHKKDGGGGVMSIARGQAIEKAGVNMSVVWGDKYPALEGQFKDKPYVAAGVSLICHPYNPNAPIAHMNVRVLQVGEGNDVTRWMGGGADLTPMVRFEEDTALFHSALKDACDSHPQGDYAHFTKWCDEYFFIPHRSEVRGVGGIFFDYLNLKSDDDTLFLSKVGNAFCNAYAEILKRRVHTPFDGDLKEKHLYWRARYAEFNLAYDRGTRFGLLSGGNTEAIFASMPPVVKW